MSVVYLRRSASVPGAATMAKQRRAEKQRDRLPQHDVPPGLIPNISLSRAARAGERTEDELLLERPGPAEPTPRVPSQAEFTHGDPWRVLRIMGEYVHAF